MSLAAAVERLKRRDWTGAHPLVQEDDSPLGCWAHGLVHLIEGDRANARYWYERAGRPLDREPDIDAEIAALDAARKEKT